MAQNRVVKSVETVDLGEEGNGTRVWMGDWPTLDSAKVEGKATMDLKEIVVESARLIKLKAREIAPSFLVWYTVAAISFCWEIVEVHGVVTRFFRAGFYAEIGNSKQLGEESIAGVITVCGVIAVSCFHLVAVCTTLLVAAPFQTLGNSNARETFNAGYVFNKAWKLFVTNVMSTLVIYIVISICAAVTVVALPRIVATSGNVMTALVVVQALVFVFSLAKFLVETTLTTAVVVLERDWAVDAMMRSSELVGSKRRAAAGVVILDVVVVTAIRTLVITSTTGPTWVKLVGFVFGVASTMAYWLCFVTMRTVLYVCCMAQKVERGFHVVGSAA